MGLLVTALGEGPCEDSASECVLLAAPFMPARPASKEDRDLLVERFASAVASMSVGARQVLAEYGRRWEVIIDTTVPIDRLCSVAIEEKRPWERRRSSSRMKQAVPWGDATTTHVEIRSADHAVVIDRPEVADVIGQRVGIAVGDWIRETADAIAIYASDLDRPYFATIAVRVRVRGVSRAVFALLFALLFALTATAAVVAARLPDGVDLVDSLALLTFPLTLAGALLLSRETTPLAERLLPNKRIALAAAMTILWTITVIRLALHAPTIR